MGKKLTHFSLFTGIGGIDLAAEWAEFETVGQCEWADYPTEVLEKHWPDVPRWRDVRDVTRESVQSRGIGEITLLSGGFPCQPHSVAGKHKGSDDERNLWPEFCRVISEVTPKWILGENVPGIYTSDNRRFFGRVLADLASLGYSVGWSTYGAIHVGARHRRERVFIVAHAGRSLQQRCFIRKKNENEIRKRNANLHKRSSCSSEFNVANTTSERWEESRDETRNISERKTEWESWTTDGFNGHIWESEPNVGRVANGVPSRVDRLKCLGNAVVPQQVYPILKAIAEIERCSNG